MKEEKEMRGTFDVGLSTYWPTAMFECAEAVRPSALYLSYQKGGDPAAPSGTATLLRLSPNRQSHLRQLPHEDGPLASGVTDFRDLTGGVYKARERIHRAMADARLLANPASWSRVAGSSPNWEGIWGLALRRRMAALCTPHCNTCVAPDVRAVLI